jgi:hypothetical protein
MYNASQLEPSNQIPEGRGLFDDEARKTNKERGKALLVEHGVARFQSSLIHRSRRGGEAN